MHRSNRHVVTSGLLGRPSSFVVNLRGGHVFVAEQLLNLPDVNAGVEQERGCRGSQ